MATPLNDAAIARFLSERRVAIIGTIGKDGSPTLAPIWFLYRDGVFRLRAAADSIKAKHLRRDPRLTVCVQDEHAPYRSVTAWGVAEIGPNDPAFGLEIAKHYLGSIAGKVYVSSEEAGVESITITMRPKRFASQDFGSDATPSAKVWLALKRVLPPSV